MFNERVAPIDVPRDQIEALYRYSERSKQVNWRAQYQPNPEFTKSLLPHMYRFLDTSIRKITYNPHALRAVVGMSGGLDSATTATLTAQTMQQARQRGMGESNLVLITFRGMSDEDYDAGSRFAEGLVNEYPELRVDIITRDLTSRLKEVNQYIDDIIHSIGWGRFAPGALTTRMISTILMEFADGAGFCALDTTNGTEIILGETVINGGGECSPLADLYKSQVYDLAELIGVPDFILNRPPINSTFGSDKVATYFKETPSEITPRLAYRVLDPILYYLFEKKYTPRTVARRLGHDLDFIEQIHMRISGQDHRRDLPYFVLNDRHKVFSRTNQSVSNRAMLAGLRSSLEIKV